MKKISPAFRVHLLYDGRLEAAIGAPFRQEGESIVNLRHLARLAIAGVIVLAGMAAVGAAPVAATTTTATTLYVATNGSNSSSNNCKTPTSPCVTIQYAVDQAESIAGPVVIQIAGSTTPYAEQVTIAPPSSSPMTSLTLQGPTSGIAAVVEPTSLIANVTEGNTGHFADNNTGNTDAIIGAQTGSTDSALTSTPAGNGASVTVANLTVNGSQITGTSPTSTPTSTSTSNPFAAPWEGIALIDTSGTVMDNTVEHIQNSGVASGDSSVLGIAVKSTHVSATVRVTGNTVQNYGGAHAINLMALSPGVLSASVTGNTLTGDPTALTAPAAQFGIIAGGLTDLSISANTISDFQSPWSVGAVWLDSQASSATCSVTGNTLTANDNGVDVHGAAGCTITGNTITAGSAGVEIGPGYSSGLASKNILVADNSITGTTTEATTYVYSGAAAVAGVPVDGVLVWDGTGNTITNNTISGFVADVYVGEDPVYLNNTASWGTTTPPSYATGATVHANQLDTPAAASSSSGVSSYGVACLNSNGDCTASPLDATGNWWGAASGPGPVGPGSGSPVSAHVNYSSWCVNSTCTPPPPGAPGTVSSASGTSTSPTGTATATNDGTTVTASGQGSFTVGQYASDPVGPPTFASAGEYFDVQVAAGSSFTALTITDCNLNGGGSLQWWNPLASAGAGAWEAVAPVPTYTAGPPACVSVTLTSSTSPTLAELTGTVFGVSTTGSAYTALTPKRLLDTRTSRTPLGANASLNLTVTGGSVPTNATAVALNVTVTNTTAASYLSVYPAGASRPVVSNLNWTQGKTVPNLVIVPVGASGEVTIYNYTGSTDVVVDLEGYFAPEAVGSTAGSYVPLTPARITDTRSGSGYPNAGQTLASSGTLNIQVTGAGGVPTSGVTGAVLNVTATNTTAAGYLTAYPAGTSRPLASNLNWTAGETVANRVVVPVSTTGMVTLYNYTGSTDVVVDVSGYFTNGSSTPANASLFEPITPVRVLDTRQTGTPLSGGSVLSVPMAGVGGIASNATAVVTNVTAANTTAASFFTVYPGGTRPTASDVNWTAGEIVPNLTLATLSSVGSTDIYNHAGSADVIVDAFGYFIPG